jgi:predicted acetyltransferase
LSVSNGTGNVSKVKGRPDISMDISHLSSLFLGGFSFYELWISKKITAADPGKIKLADYIFGVTLKPWCPYEF